ncbi:ABC transporter ATP-binding protein [Actinomyces ruminis]|uniref:ABC transporter ATP-binding protein n=1 Tax=Actinomyces ruminis TaxID=1937003 RepID=A0ABX4M9P4_9ACTO|nr:ABC transporter ATP-binding protein [Actinomyces ruminis]PHP52163.1 ABC transporter ATP-binding protein [Actinomyces ruminis]
MPHIASATKPAAVDSRAPGGAIEVSGLIKTFGRLHAVDGLNLQVRRGEVHGFLGPNGAGKSTTIRVLLGMYRRSAGRVRVLGLDPARAASAITRRTAYVPGDVALWPTLTGAQTLDALAVLRGRRDRRREAELIDAFNLDPSKPVHGYSKGNRQKVALIAALAAPCDLLILDEPSSGLDPLQEAIFQACVRAAADAGRTVLLSSHLLDEVDHVCDAVTIIKDGRTVESGTLASLRHLRDSTITCRLPDGAHAALPRGTAPPPADGDGVTRMSVPSAELSETLSALIAAGAQGLTCTPASLEDLFLRHYEGQAR